MKSFEALNASKSYAEQIKPFNFLLTAHVIPFGHPEGRFGQVRKLFIGLLTTWKTTLLLIFLVSYCWHERFWRDPVMRFTCPLLLFALSLPILGYYNFSFTQLFRKRKESLRL